jgi:hypothetical protein
MLRVGNTAAIVITPSAIVIDAEKVYINPGSTMMEALYAGRSPTEAARAQEREDRVAALTQAFLAYACDNTRLTMPRVNELLLEASRGAPNPPRIAVESRGGPHNRAEVSEAAARARVVTSGQS